MIAMLRFSKKNEKNYDGEAATSTSKKNIYEKIANTCLLHVKNQMSLGL
jgi:hypothetical protein